MHRQHLTGELPQHVGQPLETMVTASVERSRQDFILRENPAWQEDAALRDKLQPFLIKDETLLAFHGRSGLNVRQLTEWTLEHISWWLQQIPEDDGAPKTFLFEDHKLVGVKQ